MVEEEEEEEEEEVVEFLAAFLDALVTLPDPPAALVPAAARVPSALTRRRIVEFQWFLMALSVLPGRSFAISAHLLPKLLCASRIVRSSSSVHGVFLMSGFK